MIASVTLTKRNGHSNKKLKSNLKGTLTSELQWNFEMTNVQGILRYKLERIIHIEI